jgi:hypothetical protein
MTSGADPTQHIIRRTTNEEEVRSLGIYMNFHGTFAHHAKHMRFKFNGLARRLQQSAMSPTLSRIYYNTFYLPSVRYSLPVTSMTSVLNKLGYNRHYPHVVAFAPQKAFGCGLIDLRIEHPSHPDLTPPSPSGDRRVLRSPRPAKNSTALSY